jgi:hypothetical protein
MATNGFLQSAVTVEGDEGEGWDGPNTQHSKGAIFHSLTEPGARDDPGKWELYPRDGLPQLVGELNSIGPEQLVARGSTVTTAAARAACESAGVLELTRDGRPMPNYTHEAGNIYKFDRLSAAHNLINMLNNAQNAEAHKLRIANLLDSCVPDHDAAALTVMRRRAGVDTCTGEWPLSLREQMRLLMAAWATRSFTVNEGDRRCALTVICHMFEASREIPQARMIRNAKPLPRHAPPFQFVSGKDGGSREYSSAIADVVFKHEKWVNAMMNHCLDTLAKHHGTNGLASQEASANKKAARGAHIKGVDTYNDLAPGLLGRADTIVGMLQDATWDINVGGLIAAYRYSVNALVCKTELGLDDEEVRAAATYAFSRSTYRRFFASDSTLDSTRDVLASEVTQAASMAVRWPRPINEFIAIADDMEYNATRGGGTDMERKFYDKVVAACVRETSKRANTQPTIPMAQSRGEKIVDSIDTGRNAEQSIVLGRGMISSMETRLQYCRASECDHILMRVGTPHAENKVRATGTEANRALELDVNHRGVGLTYLNASSIQSRTKDPTYRYLAGMLYREEGYTTPLAMPEFMAQFQTKYEYGDISERVDRLRRLVDPASTQVHHRHVSMVATLAIAADCWAPCMDTVLRWEDVTNTFMSALLIAMASLPPALFALMECWNGWAEADSEAAFIKLASTMSTRMKALDNQVQIGEHVLDLSPLFEWNVLRHRAVSPGTIDHEIRDRRDLSQQIGVEPKQMAAEITKIFEEIASNLDRSNRGNDKPSPLYANWEHDFWENRVNLTPSGSAYTLEGSLLEARQKLKDGGVQDITKTQLMATMPDKVAMQHFIDQPQHIIAQASFKREWSKVRTLFAAPTEHWVLAAFALGTVEEYLPRDCPIGKAADLGTLCKTVMDMSTRGVVACVDAANFNILHNHHAMGSVYPIASKVLGKRLSSEQHEALAWLAQAEKKQYVKLDQGMVGDDMLREGRAEGWIREHVAGDGRVMEIAELKLGMFSGVRHTMLFNTLFNRVYYRLAAKASDVSSEALHSGDDVYAIYKNYSDAFRMKKGFKKIGYTLQLSKCFLEGVREFLRVSHKNANTTQYLTRSAATAVHGRIESNAPTDFLAYTNAILRRGAELIVRHAIRWVILDLQRTQCGAAAARWAVPNMVWDAMLKLPVVLGGINPAAVVGDHWCGFAVDRTADTRGNAVRFLATLPGIKQAARDLLDALKVHKFHNRVGEAIAAAIAPKGVIMNYGVRLRWMTKSDLEVMVKQAGKLTWIKRSREFILAKAAGLFNTLALNEGYWGDVTGMLRGIHSTWHGRLMMIALLPQYVAQKTLSSRRYILDEVLRQPAKLVDITRGTDEYLSGQAITMPNYRVIMA